MFNVLMLLFDRRFKNENVWQHKNVIERYIKRLQTRFVVAMDNIEQYFMAIGTVAVYFTREVLHLVHHRGPGCVAIPTDS